MAPASWRLLRPSASAHLWKGMTMLAQATRNLASVPTKATRSTLGAAPALDFRRALNASRAARQLELVSAPPRWNFAGFCEYCFDRGCTDLTCLARYMESAWMVC